MNMRGFVYPRRRVSLLHDTADPNPGASLPLETALQSTSPHSHIPTDSHLARSTLATTRSNTLNSRLRLSVCYAWLSLLPTVLSIIEPSLQHTSEALVGNGSSWAMSPSVSGV